MTTTKAILAAFLLAGVSYSAGPLRPTIERADKFGGRLSISADGKYLFYDSIESGRWNVYRGLIGDSAKPKCLTCANNKNQFAGNPDVHPDGIHFVFQMSPPGETGFLAEPGHGWRNSLYTSDLDGHIVQITSSPGTLHPRISRDGKMLSWAEMPGWPNKCNGSAAECRFGLWSLKLADLYIDESDHLLIRNTRTFNPGDRPAFYESHGFSCDGKNLIFSGNPTRGQPGENLGIYTMAIDGTGFRAIYVKPGEWNEHAADDCKGGVIFMGTGGHVLDGTNPQLRPRRVKWDGSSAESLTSEDFMQSAVTYVNRTLADFALANGRIYADAKNYAQGGDAIWSFPAEK